MRKFSKLFWLSVMGFYANIMVLIYVSMYTDMLAPAGPKSLALNLSFNAVLVILYFSLSWPIYALTLCSEYVKATKKNSAKEASIS